MSSLKFDLFITSGEEQLTITVDEKPVLFGTSADCDVKIGEGGPEVKATIQKEGEHLNIKIFDINYPVSINGKKYKSAKIKKSVFFKIGDIDIISDVEDLESDRLVLNDLLDPSAPPSVPTLEEMGLTGVESSGFPSIEEESYDTNLYYKEDGFRFHIKFEEHGEEERPQSDVIKLQKYFEDDWDYSSYIELWDESIKRVPIPEIHKNQKSQSIHVVHMNNGTVLNEDYFSLRAKSIFISNSKNSKSCMQIHDCGAKKLELLRRRGENATFISPVEGYDLSRVVDGKVLESDDGALRLTENERVILTKGTCQIVIQFATTPPKIKTDRFFNVEQELLKSVAISWSLILLFIGSALLYDPIEKDKEEKKKAVILVRQKKKPVESTENQPNAAESQSSKAPEKIPPKEKVVEKKPKVKPKPKKVTPVKRPKLKVAAKKKANPKKTKRKKVSPKAKKVVVKEKPKKKFKFNFGKNLKSKVSGISSSELKVAKSQGNFRNVADQVSSSTSLSGSLSNSNKFGKTNTKVARFAAGGKVGTGKNFGAKGLSGKSKSATAYVAANTKILGAIDPKLIRKLMREFIPEFRRCYQRELLKNPAVAGVFDLEFQINAKGKGSRVRVKSNGKGFSKKGIGCIKRVVSLIRFPKPKGGGLVDVKQPMNFYNQ